MQSGVHFLNDFGSGGLSMFWFPVAIWTVMAMCTIGILKIFEDKISAVYHYHSRVALLWGLAAGVLGSLFFHYFPMSSAGSNELSARFIVIQNPITTIAATPSTAINWTNPALWLGIATLLIVGITAVALVKLIIDFHSLRSFSKYLRVDVSERNRISEANKQLMAQFSNISVVFSDEVDIPCTFGWLKKRVVLPGTLADHPEKLNMALRHELTHIANNDFLINTSVKIIKALFVFHPLAHRLADQIDEYREIHCDQHVLQDNTISQKNYAQLLFELSPKSVFKTTAAVNMAVHPSTLKKRIQTMKTSTRHMPSFRRSIILMMAAALMITGLMACSDMEENGITQSEVQNTQANIDKAPDDQSPLIVINGERMTSSDSKDIISRLKPKYIKSINVLKDKKATEGYGEAGKNGVVEITLSVDKDIAFNDLADHAPKSVQFRKDSGDDVYVSVEKNPEIIGGQKALYEKLTYPESCQKAGIEGRVILQFIVTKQGNVKNAQVVKGIGGGCDQAALNAIEQMHFKPATQDGQPVNIQYSWPVLFQLSGKDDKEQK